MPAYYFHLAFELHQRAAEADAIFKPAANQNLFDSSLPSHRASSWVSYLAPKRSRSRSWCSSARRTSTRPALHHRKTSATSTAAEPSLRATTKSKNTHEGTEDWRFDWITLDTIDMEVPSVKADPASLDHRVADSGLALKGRYVPSNPKSTEFGWGTVHLYRDAEPSPELQDELRWNDQADHTVALDEDQVYVDEHCTTVCILAVPSYMTPSDLLGWLGESTVDQISHLRLIRSSRANKYMVLMKFRDSESAKRWQKEWNGTPFTAVEVGLHSHIHG